VIYIIPVAILTGSSCLIFSVLLILTLFIILGIFVFLIYQFFWFRKNWKKKGTKNKYVIIVKPDEATMREIIINFFKGIKLTDIYDNYFTIELIENKIVAYWPKPSPRIVVFEITFTNSNEHLMITTESYLKLNRKGTSIIPLTGEIIIRNDFYQWQGLKIQEQYVEMLNKYVI